MAIFHAEFFSKCLMRLVDVDICLPIEDLVEPQPQEGPFPTLYLLHGYTGRSEDWLHGSCIAELSPPVRHCRGNAQWGKQLL